MFFYKFGGSRLSTYPLMPGGPTTYRFSLITEPSIRYWVLPVFLSNVPCPCRSALFF
jgi:hypothetical protein